jgi:glutamate--cysteine ligase
MKEPEVDEAEWLFHLSTLFPEVRPKQYFELRSVDTIEPDSLAAPVVFVTGLVYDQTSAVIATEILGLPDPDLLLRAGSHGLADREICGSAMALCEFSIEGAERLGEDYISKKHRDDAWTYFKALRRKFQP